MHSWFRARCVADCMLGLFLAQIFKHETPAVSPPSTVLLRSKLPLRPPNKPTYKSLTAVPVPLPQCLRSSANVASPVADSIFHFTKIGYGVRPTRMRTCVTLTRPVLVRHVTAPPAAGQQCVLARRGARRARTHARRLGDGDGTKASAPLWG